MAAYCRVYDSRHLQADCKNRDQLRNPTLGNRVWATFLYLMLSGVDRRVDINPSCETVIGFKKLRKANTTRHND